MKKLVLIFVVALSHSVLVSPIQRFSRSLNRTPVIKEIFQKKNLSFV